MVAPKPKKLFTPLNPLDRENLGLRIAEALLAVPPQPLPPSKPFIGAGVYAIYYSGPFPLYKKIAAKNTKKKFSLPIYVGKAVPAGTRKGSAPKEYEGQALYNRLKEHASSIKQAPNLNLADFSCRYLPMEPVWIQLGESLLINMFSPLWNGVIDGFGNHDPGSGRYAQKKSSWDVLHGGRAWATKLTGKHPELGTVEKMIAIYSEKLK
jgi:hypothetical protein